MGKRLFITEKPSVGMEFAKALSIEGQRRDGYLESKDCIITWCVGHLVTLSYPEKYNPNLKKWSIQDLPFIPEKFKYEVIDSVKKQFEIVKNQLKREDVSEVYVCTDSGREGEYIYRLIEEMVDVKKSKKRVWINSQTEEEIERGVREALDLSEYDLLAKSAYIRAIEDYLAGINFSRLMTLLYSSAVNYFSKQKNVPIVVGRVMSCVLGMVVDREREIRNFKKSKFYKLSADFIANGEMYTGEWRVQEKSKYFNSPKLFNDKGFLKKEEVEKLKKDLEGKASKVVQVNKKLEKKNPPLLFNLAELQNQCSKILKINPDQTLNIVQKLYESKLVTYPRTDARFLSKAVAKEIESNIRGIFNYIKEPDLKEYANQILEKKSHKNIEKTKYVNDSKVTDHYAIIPTGKNIQTLSKLSSKEKLVYDMICRRFLAIFFEAAQFSNISIQTQIENEIFFSDFKVCKEKGYMVVLNEEVKEKDIKNIKDIKKNQNVDLNSMQTNEGETSPPKRYSSGTMILAMENAGRLIEDDNLREQIKGSGIGTSATRAEIIKKLVRLGYIQINNKTQIITPNPLGEYVFEVIKISIPDLLNPKLTASWEKGLQMIVDGDVDPQEYMKKLTNYIQKSILGARKNVKDLNQLIEIFSKIDDKNIIDIPKDEKNKANGLGLCPVCNRGFILEYETGYGCSMFRMGCKFFVSKEICGVKIKKEDVLDLIKIHKTKKISGFKSKKDTFFDASLIVKNGKIVFEF